MMTHLVAIGLALLIDWLIGDPRSLPHPVVWIGRLIAKLEALFYKQSQKINGVIVLSLVLAIVFSTTFALVYCAYFIHFLFGLFVEALLISFAIARRSLKEAAYDVYKPLQTKDLAEARLKLSYIVGRDTEHLEEAEIVRGTVETVAENTTDGVTSPMFFALLGGAPLAMLYRAVNTCDSMLGYKNEKYLHFGWASARFDDLMNYIPARLTGLLMMLTRMRHHYFTKRKAWQILFSDAKKHPSPNGGWTETAVAVLLGIQLGGWNRYKGVASFRETMGRKMDELTSRHIVETVKIMNVSVLGFYLFISLLGGFVYVVAKAWG